MFHILLLNKQRAPETTSAGNLDEASQQPRRASRAPGSPRIRGHDLCVQSVDTDHGGKENRRS